MKWQEFKDAWKVDLRSEAGFLGGLLAGAAKLLPTVGSALGIAGGIKDIFGGGGDEGQQQYAQGQGMPAFQQEAGQYLSNLLQQYGGQFEPGKAYPGQLSAPATGMEQQSLGILGNVMGQSPTGPGFEAAQSELMKTLSGAYADPMQSPYIQAQRTIGQRDLQDAITQMKGQRGGLGSYFHSENLANQRQLQERTLQNLQAQIGQFQEAERGRQFAAAPEAARLDEYSQLIAPLKQVAAGQEFGSLDRTLQQADYERQYGEWQRQQQGLAGLPEMASQLYGSNPRTEQFYTPQGASTLDRILGNLPGIQGNLGGLLGSSLGASGANRTASPQGQIGSQTGYRYY